MRDSSTAGLLPMQWPSDFHAVQTITLGELIEYGFVDWTDDSWHFNAYSDEQYSRWTELFNGHFFWREIALVPPGKWKQMLLQRLNEVMPKYNMLYKLEEQGLDPLQISNEYGKSRDIFSEFPQTMLSGNSDYASTGNDRQFERVTEGDVIEKFGQVQQNYKSVDMMLMAEVEDLFSCLYTVNVNSF